ncbi:GSCOCG00006747001-RA-CDS [Cotesia congregata]|uniref:Similar to TNXB: Tenascin-X (Homo sapiens) n=1 Tax=Cotesia congregata TaxID=51543 RepID=A0A8J2H6J8_COTCN|nr:GSCOCG00006747001-RA-CDS [Cotesia congregata]CAG5078938.1 Similar to TNXB: Tenascin-X (Homo sapiens) [Cotesia congregata]
MYTYGIILLLVAGFLVPSVSAKTCKPDEITVYGECVTYRTEPGTSCESSFLNCQKVPNTYCNNTTKLCSCRWGYILDNKKCLPGLDNDCDDAEPDKKCKTDNSKCSDKKKCVCKDGYIQNMRDCVEKATGIDRACSSDLACTHLNNTHCFNGTCQCKPGFDKIGDTCTAGLYSPCDTKNKCKGANQECKDDHCMCNGNSFAKDRECKPFTAALEGECDHFRACETIGHAICFNKHCQCNWNYFKDDVTGKCVGGLYAMCKSDECQSPAYKCHEGKCICADGYQESVGKCVAIK